MANMSMKSRSSSSRGVGWRGPLIMFMSLLSGIALALVQHFYYRFLNGKRADSGFGYSQRWVISAGTALSLASVGSMVAALAIAYVQQQWLSLRTRLYRINQVDDITGVLNDVSALFNLKLWAKNPILFIMGLVFWLLPIIPVFTPGALTIDVTDDLVHYKMFKYDPLCLYIAYSIAAFLTTAGVVIGYFAIKANGGTYENKFSTFVRSTRNEDLFKNLSSHSHTTAYNSKPLPMPKAKTLPTVTEKARENEDDDEDSVMLEKMSMMSRASTWASVTSVKSVTPSLDWFAPDDPVLLRHDSWVTY